MRSFRRYGRINLTMHLTRHRGTATIRNALHTPRQIDSIVILATGNYRVDAAKHCRQHFGNKLSSFYVIHSCTLCDLSKRTAKMARIALACHSATNESTER